MKKLPKKTALTMGLAALLALSACKSKEKKAEREAAAEHERVAAVERERAEAKRQEDKLTDVIYDSLMNIPNTVNDLSAKQAEVYCNDFNYGSGMGTKRELDSLTNVRMANVLHQRVISTAKPIAERHLKELYASLATYNLGVDANSRIEKILSGEPYDSKYNIILLNFYGEELADTVYGFYSGDFEWGKQDFVSAILYGADTAQYGAGRKAEIVKIVEKRYVQMMEDLKANRIAVAKQFADYYPVLDLNRIPKQYRKHFANYDPALSAADGSTWCSYEDGWMLTPSFAIEKYVSVYDSKLKPEFFNVPGATYKLVQVSKGKWKVVRTLKSGKKDETPVFAHNVDYVIRLNTWVADGVKQGDGSFSAEAGANLGVHIYVTEYEYVARAVKSDKVPDPKGERAVYIEHLQKKANEVHVLDSMATKYAVAARENARKMAQRRLGHNR